MKPRRTRRFVYRWIPLTGLVFLQGCLAAAERNLDLLLSPNALENTLRLSSSAIGSWGILLIKLFEKVL